MKQGKKKTRKKRPGRVLRFITGLLLAIVLASLLPVLAFRWLTPPTSAVILQRSLTEDRQQNWQWTDIENISPHVALAVVAAEDQKFPQHRGFDLQAIQAAIEHNSRGERVRGASTLTQQVARNLFLWQGRSYLRKGLEAWFTLLLELCWPKQRILEVYLNIAETGPQTFGMEAAAWRYFSRPASRLTREQAALLAAILPNPRRLQAQSPSPYVLERRKHILQQMQQLGGTKYLDGILPAANIQ